MARVRRRRGSSSEPPTPRKGQSGVQEPQVIHCEQNPQGNNGSTTPNPGANLSLLDHVVEFDRKFSAWVHEHGLGIFFYVFLRTLEFSGDGVFLIPCAAATFLAPKPKLTPELRMFFFNLFMAFLFDLIFVSIIKKIVRRPRPVYNRNHFMTVQVDHWSFPSGHSTRALMVVTMFGLYIPMWRDQSHQIWLPFLQQKLQKRIDILADFVPAAETILISLIGSTVTAWAIATTSSRIILGRHFFCDVVAGSLLGIFEAFFAYYFLAIPIDTSEEIHWRINGVFAWIENSTWRLFHGRNFLDIHDGLLKPNGVKTCEGALSAEAHPVGCHHQPGRE